MNHFKMSEAAKFGKILSHPTEENEIVISGISGSFPMSENIAKFHENLKNKVDMTTRRIIDFEIHGEGIMKNREKFDSGYFGMSLKNTKSLHPIGKLLLEKCYECIFDAGLHPSDLEGTKTGIYMGFYISEFFVNTILGHMNSALANRISYHLKIQGPSLVVNSACSSSSYALEAAFKAIRMGQVDSAIVCAGSVLSEFLTSQYRSLGVLTKDGYSRPFDKNASGYLRAEGVVAILLQKSSSSKRVYAKVLHAKTSCSGFVEQGIMQPSGEAQLNLLREIYFENTVDPSQVVYLEAHATGTRVGDPIEINSLDTFFGKNRNGNPLLIGSVKSNMGHTENVSFLSSLIKVILAFESGTIPSNLNFDKPMENMHGVIEGRLKVVTENTELPNSPNAIIGFNNSGFGGTNAHVCIKQFSKVKIHTVPKDNLPRLVCVSGRTIQAVQVLLNDIEEKFDEEHICLIHNIFRKPIRNHIFRGYVIISQIDIKKSISKAISYKNNLTIIFGGLVEISEKLLLDLLNLTVLAAFQNRLFILLAKHKINLQTLSSKSSSLLVNLLTQLVLAELLKLLNIEYKLILGYSLGQLTSLYFEGKLTLEEFINISSTITEDDLQSLESEFDKHCIFQKQAIFLQIGYVSSHKGICVNLGQQIDFFAVLETFGRLYELGVHLHIQFLYPKVDFPVSRTTPMISPMIKWKHDQTWPLSFFTFNMQNKKYFKSFEISLDSKKWNVLKNHIVDGQIVFPSAGYLFLAWETLANMLNVNKTDIIVLFEHVKFVKPCFLTKILMLDVVIEPFTGIFEISDNNIVVVTGRISTENKEYAVLTDLKRRNYEDSKDPLLTSNDIYKEFNLRGYNYRGIFQSLIECNQSLTCAKIKWMNDWIVFLDNLLQIQIININSRLLSVPTMLRKVLINPEMHLDHIELAKIENSDSEVELQAYFNRDLGVLQSGGMEVIGAEYTSIYRQKSAIDPVLEKYQFVPYRSTTDLNAAVSLLLQVILENTLKWNIKIIELIDEFTLDYKHNLASIVCQAIEKKPLVNCTVISINPKNIDQDPIHFKSPSDIYIIICSSFFSRNEIPFQGIEALKDSSFVISRELRSSNIPVNDLFNMQILSFYEIPEENEKLVLLKKTSSQKQTGFINILDGTKNFSWMINLKEAIKEFQEVILWCQDEPLSGILGLVNCLRKEHAFKNARLLFVMDEAPKFNPKLPFYKNQLDKGLAINVYMNNMWGSYKHLPLDEIKEIEIPNCYCSTAVEGDLSTLKWFEGPLLNSDEDDKLIQVYYSSVNLSDLKVIYGKLTYSSINKDSQQQQSETMGMEFSGKIHTGKRVMGLLPKGALATLVKANYIWEVPQNWSLKDAATVPIAYSTCLYSLFMVGKIKPTDSVLIQNGTEDFGLAALNLCTNIGCTIFTTINSQEKYRIVKNNFPHIVGVIKPLRYTIYQSGQVEKAFRYMTTDTHIGKILVEIQNENSDKEFKLFKGLPKYHCQPNRSYVICGGLGGFGLELADWLIRRGARNVILSSRRNITTGYQAYRIRIWKSYGCNIVVSPQDISTRNGCQNLLKEANCLAPVEGIFNLTIALKAAIFTNQTEESFKVPLRPKAIATEFLDEISRLECPYLKQFVVFSSASCGRGYPGQTNYGMANSVMERLCEARRKQGFPALAIQWGAIGDVGIVADMFKTSTDLEIEGTVQQNISSCLQTMDRFMVQQEAVIVSSMALAKKHVKEYSNIIEAVIDLLGLRKSKAVSLHSILANLGMDSFNVTEVKEMLENNYHIFLTAEKLRHLTLAQIQKLHESRSKSENDGNISVFEGKTLNIINKQIMTPKYSGNILSKIILLLDKN
ncbi:hypothetical protein ABEB36_008436 [Hypothenemus hampei]|uniref:Uncharacterized protein n=1 Tax=Hypothenemus hampei TaxID=57062 RepID=A0ABD1ELW2_HYPHA